MGKFWLIQRGKFRKLDTATEFFGPGEHHLISGDYMGSAEFELGAIPKAYRRIMDHYGEYSLHVTDLTTIRGVPFCLFCRDEFYEEILQDIKDYLDNPYPLKENSNMKHHFTSDYDKSASLQTNFWWCIDKVRQTIRLQDRHNGDWFAFIGATDRQKAIQRVIDNDYNTWWMTMDENRRKAMIKDAYQ